MDKSQQFDARPVSSLVSRLKRSLLRVPENGEQLIELLRLAQQRNLFDPDALSMIEGVLQCS